MTKPARSLFEEPWPEGEYRLFQLGFVVDDLLEGAARWARVLGVGPFHVTPRRTSRATYRGAPSNVEVQYALAQAGPVQIELIKQHCNRPSMFRDVFAAGDSGFHQLCTVSMDYDAKVAQYEQLGYELVGEIETPGRRIAYFDTFADFGFYIEVVEHSRELVSSWDRIARTCAEWDGRDPVRLVTRDGYTTP
jgi:Glyoxalase/Bleomycin resistance protein/Dioxygenase superfamily